MSASYLCIATNAEVDFEKGLGIASATFANVITGTVSYTHLTLPTKRIV